MRSMLEERLRDIKNSLKRVQLVGRGGSRETEGEGAGRGGGVDGDPIACRGRGSSSSVSSIRLKCYQAGLNVRNVS